MKLKSCRKENSSCAVLAVSALFMTAGWSSGATIDLFLDSPQFLEISSPNGGEWASADPAVLGDGLFEIRSVRMQYGAQRFSVSDGLLNYEVNPPPVGSFGNSAGYFELTYHSATPVNLLGDGADALRLLFLGYEAANQWLSLSLTSGNTTQRYSINEVRPGISLLTAIDIPFTAFDELNLTEVDSMQLSGARLPVGSNFQLAGITTVPEPSAAALCGAFGALLAFRRMRSSRG